MKKVLILTLFSIFLAGFQFSCSAEGIELSGKWIQKEKSRDGFGEILIFRQNGSVSLHYGSILETMYFFQDSFLVETETEPNTTKVVARYQYEVNDKSMTLQRVISFNPLNLSNKITLIRSSRSDSPIDNNSIVGQWISDSSDEIPNITEYTRDGKKLFYIPVSVKKGEYALDKGTITITTKDPENNVKRYRVEQGALLEITGKNTRYVKF